MSETCTACRFWLPEIPDRGDASIGECHRHAPVQPLLVTTDQYRKHNERGTWPETAPTAWCGDWEIQKAEVPA